MAYQIFKCTIFIILVIPCVFASPIHETKSKEEATSVDHILLLVSNARVAQQLVESGFSEAVPLSNQHRGQGTSGRYFLFFNMFIVLLELSSPEEAQKNIVRFGSNYVSRWKAHGPQCALGIALRELPVLQDDSRIKFKKYIPLADSNNFYWMDINNQNSTQPFIFVPKAEFKYRTLNSLQDIARVKDPEKRNQLKSFLSHTNGVRSLTKAEFTLVRASKFGQMKLKNIHVTQGTTCRLT